MSSTASQFVQLATLSENNNTPVVSFTNISSQQQFPGTLPEYMQTHMPAPVNESWGDGCPNHSAMEFTQMLKPAFVKQRDATMDKNDYIAAHYAQETGTKYAPFLTQTMRAWGVQESEIEERGNDK